MTEISCEMANDGIRVNAVAPGIIPTETIKNQLKPEAMQRIKSMQYLPLRVTGGFAAGI